MTDQRAKAEGDIMKALIMTVTLGWLLVWCAEPALASCTTQTIFLPDGRTMVCSTCCYNGNCNTTCF